MTEKKKMTDDELRSVIARQLSSTLNSTDSELRTARSTALDYYYGRPLGNEITGRSQVVSKDLMDTIEWMMPSLLRIFSRDAVQFDPVGPEDEQLARQETDYVNHVFYKQNPGFMLLYTWFKDALLQKVGYVKYWWETQEKVCFDEYTGLTEDEVVAVITSLQEKGEVKVVGSELVEDGSYSIKLRYTKKYGRAHIEGVPPEEMVVDSHCRGDVKSAKFAGHLRRVSNSDLLEMGYTRKRIEDLTDFVWNISNEKAARDSVNETQEERRETGDWASEERLLLEGHAYVDYDGDGIAELRRVFMGGNDILENEEAPEIPFESLTAIPVPHRHAGLSMYDLVEDLTRIKTALIRQLLDNTYFTNNQRVFVDENTVNMTDLMINRPGGHIRVSGSPAAAALPMPVQPIAGRLLPVIDYIDDVKETRTGVGRITAGVDANVLANSTKGAYLDARNAANQRIEAIARIFAETGVSSLFSSLHRLLMRHQDWQTRMKIREDWVPINPAEWQERANLTVTVGLGNTSADEIRSNLAFMAQAQEKIQMTMPGLVQPLNVFALYSRMQRELGFERERFITNPESPEYLRFAQSQKGQPDPYVQGKQIEAQVKMKEGMTNAQLKHMELVDKRNLKIAELELDHSVDIAEQGIAAELGTREIEAENQRAEADARVRSAEAAREPAVE